MYTYNFSKMFHVKPTVIKQFGYYAIYQVFPTSYIIIVKFPVLVTYMMWCLLHGNMHNVVSASWQHA